MLTEIHCTCNEVLPEPEQLDTLYSTYTIVFFVCLFVFSLFGSCRVCFFFSCFFIILMTIMTNKYKCTMFVTVASNAGQQTLV